VTSIRLARVLIVAMLSCCSVLAAGCSTHKGGSWVGSVTTVRPVLCVGRHVGTGECFYKVTPATRARLTVGQCVLVVFGTSDARGRYPLKSVKRVAANKHTRDCGL
jgi:hypothetical protein